MAAAAKKKKPAAKPLIKEVPAENVLSSDSHDNCGQCAICALQEIFPNTNRDSIVWLNRSVEEMATRFNSLIINEAISEEDSEDGLGMGIDSCQVCSFLGVLRDALEKNFATRAAFHLSQVEFKEPRKAS